MSSISLNIRAISSRRFIQIGAALALLIAVGVALPLLLGGTRRPPSIFDAPVDDVLDFLAVEEFSELSVEERLEFMGDVIERFAAMNQSDSALAAAFLAGLTGHAREQLRDNVRVLARDVLVEAADGYFALKTDEERAKFLDDWLLGWARYAGKVTGEDSNKTDQELLADMRRDSRRDNERAIREPIPANETNAWLFMDYWNSEVESVSSPVEQAKILHFLPALREHLLREP